MIDADYELAARLQAQEHQDLTIEERSKMFVELMDKRKKHFARLRVEEQRRNPPTKAQKRSQMSTYLKHMAGYKQNQLKSKNYDEIQKLFDKAMIRVNMFVDVDTELVKESSKKADMLDENVEAKVDDEVEMKNHMEILPDDEIGYFQIIRADGSSRRYSSMIKMLQNIDREDLETLWKLVKAKYRNTMPEEAFEKVLWGDLKVMFEPDIESEVNGLSHVRFRLFFALNRMRSERLSDPPIIVTLVGQILLDHLLSYAFTDTADIPVVYLQQFWKTVSKVPNTKDTIKFKLDTHEITYTIDMFRDTLHLPVETPGNPFIAPVNIKVVESFMQTVGYQCVVNKKFPSIPKRLDEDYHSIKDDIPLVSVYSTWNMLFRGMPIPNAFLTNEIHATDDYKENTPRAHRTPTLTTTSPHGKKRKQSEEDEESYASTFADSMLNNDIDDSSTRIKPGSHKKNPEVIDDDDVNDKEKEDEKKNDDDQPKNDDVEKTNDVAKEKNNDATGSMETRNEQMQTPTPTPNRSPRKHLSSDKIIFEELTTTVSPTTATTSKFISKRGFTSNKTKILPESIMREVLDHCNNVVPELTFAKTNEMINEEMPRLVNLAVQKDRVIASTNVPELISKEFSIHGPKIIEQLFQKHMQNTTLNLYPTTSSSTAEISIVDLQHQLYLTMKTNYQDQAADPELWEILKTKFENP
ncbi:hypothetical protein Tco_0001442 [Tanacetum coccineum]